ncbi:MAG: bifunctional phosphoglucose/phosphomannose isomerase [Actinomycetota bacterium]|nr:bifunctional phosphoglucose/phosphomannose isomerase [Actinomycetota bacterium]
MPIDLDDLRAVRALDSAGAFEETARYADQFREGRALMDAVDGPLGDPPREVMILGTGGGSAAAAKLLAAAVTRRCSVAIQLNQGYEIPAHVGPETFVIAVSHSGTTEEILSAYEEALARGCRSVVLTSGGGLKEVAEVHGAPVISVPGGQMPRIVLGYLIVPLLGLLERLGLIEHDAAEFADLLEVLAEGPSRFGPDVPLDRNPAKSLALELSGKTPVVYGLNPVTSAAADRWKRQFGENSKVMAFANAFPDAHHDEAVGWDQEAEALKRFSFVVLSDERADPRLLRRVSASREVLTERGAAVEVVEARGHGTLGRLFSLVQHGDYVTLYLALCRGIDPTPVPVIDHFKSVLAKA